MTRTSKETGESSATPGPRGGESPGKGEGRASATAAMTPFKAKLENQVPYVNVFRAFKVESGTGAALRGDVRGVVDDVIHKRCLKIEGAVPTSGYVMIPKGRGGNAGLTGRFVYIQARIEMNKPFLINLEVDTDSPAGRPVRLSLGSLIKVAAHPDTKGAASGDLSVRIPLHPDAPGWHVMCIDMQAAMEEYAGVAFKSLRCLQVCASCVVRNVFTSPHRYSLLALPQEMVLSHRPEVAADMRCVWLPREPVSVEEQAGTPAGRGGPSARKKLMQSPLRAPLGEVAQNDMMGRVKVTAAARSQLRTTRPIKNVKASKTAAEAMLGASSATPPAPTGLIGITRVGGYSGDHPRTLAFAPGGSELAMACQSIVVAWDLTGDAASFVGAKQRIFRGHTASVCAIAFSACGRVMATAEEGTSAQVRVWDFRSGQCLAVLKEHHSGICALHVSPDARSVAAVGLNPQARNLLAVWDIQGAFTPDAATAAELEAKVVLDHPVAGLKFSPFERLTLVSCGPDSVRVHRVRHGRIRSCGIKLSEGLDDPAALAVLESNRFIDLDFDVDLSSLKTESKYVYVAAASGHVIQVDLGRMRVERILLLHGGPITSLTVTDGVCVTGSADHLLRAWQMDFADYLLEAEHDGPLTCVTAADGGRLVAAATLDGTVGVLDTHTHEYVVLARSHTDDITGVAASADGKLVATRSRDLTVRVWDTKSLQHKCELAFPGETASCLLFNSRDSNELVVGFESGMTRIVDVARAAILGQYHQHREAVCGAVFSASGALLVTGGLDGHLVVHDVQQSYLPVKYLQLSPPPEGCQMPLCADAPTGLIATVSVEAVTGKAQILVFRDETLEPFVRVPLEEPYLPFLRFCGDSSSLVGVTGDGDIVMTSMPDGALEYRRPKALQNPVVDVHFDNTASMILAATDDSRIHVLSHPLSKVLGTPVQEVPFLTDNAAPLGGLVMVQGQESSALVAQGRSLMSLVIDMPDPDPLRHSLRVSRPAMVEAGLAPEAQASRMCLEDAEAVSVADSCILSLSGRIRAVADIRGEELAVSYGHVLAIESIRDATRSILRVRDAEVSHLVALDEGRDSALLLLALDRPNSAGFYPILTFDRRTCRAVSVLLHHREPIRFMAGHPAASMLLTQDESGTICLFDVHRCTCVAAVASPLVLHDAQPFLPEEAAAGGEEEVGAGAETREPQGRLTMLLSSAQGVHLLDLSPPALTITALHECEALVSSVRGSRAVMVTAAGVTLIDVGAGGADVSKQVEERERQRAERLQALGVWVDSGDEAEDEGAREERALSQLEKRGLTITSHVKAGMAVSVRDIETAIPGPSCACLVDRTVVVGTADGVLLRYAERSSGGMELRQRLELDTAAVSTGSVDNPPQESLRGLRARGPYNRIIGFTDSGVVAAGAFAGGFDWQLNWLSSSPNFGQISPALTRNAFASLGPFMWMVDDDMLGSVWSMRSNGSVVPLMRFNCQDEVIGDAMPEGDEVTVVVVSRTGDVMCLCRMSGEVCIRGSVSGKALWTKLSDVHKAPVIAAFFSEDQSVVVAIDARGHAVAFRTIDGEQVAKFSLRLPGPATSIHATDKLIAAAGDGFVETSRVVWEEGPGVDVPKLKRGSHVDLDGVDKVVVLGESWVLVLAEDLHLLSGKDSQLVGTGICGPCSVRVGGHHVLVGTQSGHLVRIDPRELAPTHMIDIASALGPRSESDASVSVLSVMENNVAVACKGCFVEVDVMRV